MFDCKLAELNKEWRVFGKNQFEKIPSVFFATIAREHKEKTAVNPTATSCFDPSEFLDAQSLSWAVWWDPIVDHCDDHFTPKFHRLREYCVKHVSPPVVNPDLQVSALGNYPSKAKGSDNLTAKEFACFPTVCRLAQCEAMQLAYNSFVVPHQLLLNLSSLIGKQGGGSRTIGLTPMWHRYFGKSDATVAEWETVYTQSYDKAGKGKSALVTAAVLNLKAEVAVIFKQFVVSAFHDIRILF